jgi:hypothetical protein
MTSPLFAMPVVLWWAAVQWPEHSHLPWLTDMCLLMSIVTATFSTLYHHTLYAVMSSLDTSMATLMCFATTFHIWRPLLAHWDDKDFNALMYGVLGSLTAVFAWHWVRIVSLL